MFPCLCTCGCVLTTTIKPHYSTKNNKHDEQQNKAPYVDAPKAPGKNKHNQQTNHIPTPSNTKRSPYLLHRLPLHCVRQPLQGLQESFGRAEALRGAEGHGGQTWGSTGGWGGV